MEVLRYTAFSSEPAGGNPAGVVLDATGLTDAQMLRTAAELGYSESAFLLPAAGRIRYWSPLAEVSFVPAAPGSGIDVSGTAVRLPDPSGT